MNYNKFNNYDVKKEDSTLIVLLNRPPVNALCESVFKELQEIVKIANHDAEIITIVIGSALPNIFTVGADVKEHLKKYARKLQKAIINLNLGHATFNLIEESPKPFIIALRGTSYGGGIELSCACDIRIASEDTKFAMPETRIGFIPGYGGTQRLPRLIGYGAAKRFIFKGEEIDAHEALRIRLIDEITPVGKELEKAIEIAESIAKGAPQSIAFTKKAINAGMTLPLEEALEKEKELFIENLETKAWSEGLYGFIQKRKPKFERIGT